MNYNGKEVIIDLWDTAGQKDLEKLRPLAYPGANCFLVCFSLVDRTSFKNAYGDWRAELLALGPTNCPRILVGLKSDLREELLKDSSKRDQCITTEEGNKIKTDYNFQ